MIKSELHCNDCLKSLKKMPDKSFDLAIVDPYYGKTCVLSGGKSPKDGFSEHWKTATEKENYNQKPGKEYFDHLFRVSKNQIIWGANHLPEFLPPSGGWLFWDKGQRNFSFSDGELAFTSFNQKLRVIELSRGKASQEFKIHPFQKPVELYRRILKLFAETGQSILDTHSGSGSLRIACYEMNMPFTGFEIDPEYYEKSIERFEKVQAQKSLFV